MSCIFEKFNFFRGLFLCHTLYAYIFAVFQTTVIDDLGIC